MAQIDLKDATIKILDGTTPTPNEITVKIGEGNLTYTEKRNIEYVKDRGELDTTREGDEEPTELSIDAVWEEITASAGLPPSIKDAIKGVGEASTWVSTGGDCEPYAVDVVVEVDVSCGTVEDEQLTFSEFRYEQVDHDLRAGTFAISGMCNETMPTAVRTTL